MKKKDLEILVNGIVAIKATYPVERTQTALYKAECDLRDAEYRVFRAAVKLHDSGDHKSADALDQVLGLIRARVSQLQKERKALEVVRYEAIMSHNGTRPRRLKSETLAEAQAEAIRVWGSPEPGLTLHLHAYADSFRPQRGHWVLRFGQNWEKI